MKSINCSLIFYLFTSVKVFQCTWLLKPSFHMIAHDRRIAENAARNCQRFYGNIFHAAIEQSSAIAIAVIEKVLTQRS